MLDYNHIIGNLIKSRKSNQKVIAACIYGSQVQGMATPTSDLDVLLITGDGKSYRGCSTIDGIRVEYFEKPFMTIINEIEMYHKKGSSFYASFFRNHKVIFDSNQMIPYLAYHQVLAESQPSIIPNIDYSDVAFYQLQLQNCTEISDFNHYYYVLLECLRQKYHEENGYSNIDGKYVLDLYRNQKKAEFYCVTLPSKDYKDFFYDSVRETITKEEQIQRLEEAFHYLNIKQLDGIESKELNSLNINMAPHYMISFMNSYQKIDSNQKQYGAISYPYHNLMEQIGNLKRLYEKSGKKPFITDEEYNQLLTKQDMLYIKSILLLGLRQFEINPSKYEISYFQKKYRN